MQFKGKKICATVEKILLVYPSIRALDAPGVPRAGDYRLSITVRPWKKFRYLKHDRSARVPEATKLGKVRMGNEL